MKMARAVPAGARAWGCHGLSAKINPGRRRSTGPLDSPPMTDRCGWAESSDLMIAYHDREWGVPLHDDRRHFEFLLLDGFQAGLSWAVILNKREGFRRAFDGFVWEFVGGATKRNAWKTLRQIPARTKESDRLSRALQGRGFKFVGSTICYAYMQAAGLVNDHLVSCFRRADLRAP